MKPSGLLPARKARQAPSFIQPSTRESCSPQTHVLPSLTPTVESHVKKLKNRRKDVAGTYNTGESAIPHGMFDQLRGSDWKERDNALKVLENFVVSQHGNIGSLLLTKVCLQVLSLSPIHLFILLCTITCTHVLTFIIM